MLSHSTFLIQPRAIHVWSTKYSLSTSSLVLQISLTSLPTPLCFDPVVTNLNVYRARWIELMSKAGIRWIFVCIKTYFQGAISYNIELLFWKWQPITFWLFGLFLLEKFICLYLIRKTYAWMFQLCQNSFQTFSVGNHSLDHSEAFLDGPCLSYVVRWLNSDLAEMGCV